KVSVKIPAGIKDGARLRLKKMGNHSPEGERGDLYIHINVS
ncbi:MAG: J domain-containing protein, partial [Deltaproteobacteria bacterium]|nr:J domain-containing protein [Deltaproteobacteria bacterium]